MENWNPNYGGKTQFKKKNHFDLSNGPVIARILPQPKYQENGEWTRSSDWYQYRSVVFGYKNVEGKHRRFESCERRKNKEVVVRCAASDRIEAFKAKLEEAKKGDDAALTAKLNALVGMKGVYNIDRNVHMNVVLLDGSIGELKIRHKAFLLLQDKIQKLKDGVLEDRKVNPVNLDDGRFFVFSRNVNGRDTTFDVTVYKEKIDVPGVGKVDRDFVHKVDQALLNRLDSEGFDLQGDEIASYLSPDEISQIVNESDLMTGKSPACDRLFDARWKAEREAKKATADTVVDKGGNGSFTSKNVLTTNTEPAANLTAPVAAPVTAPTVASAPVAAPAKPAAVDELSDDEFFKACGVST